jgi:hypothetical protein
MSDLAPPTGAVPALALDLSHIDDPEVRRALRALHAELEAQLAQKQLEIDALLQLMIDKHLTSIGEFRREIARLQQNQHRVDRLHGAIAGTPVPHAPPPAAATGTLRRTL